MTTYNVVASTSESTVVAEYKFDATRSTDYQCEADLEKELIQVLSSQGYERLLIHSEQDLVSNLKTQLERINAYVFTKSEWERFYQNKLSNPNEGIIEKTKKIQEDYIQVLNRDDGSSKNIYLLDKKNIHNNYLQVINQYEEAGGTRDTRYDVTILVNGLPLVHIELKRRGVAIREAFNQIKRYQRDSFWASSGLYEYVQIFVISNGTHTRYYSNTTRNQHLKESLEALNTNAKKTSNSFEFTSYWADEKNRVIPDLVDFTKTFFAKHTLLNILTKYCVFTSEELLLVMRPYQIAATEKILKRIEIASNYKTMGTIKAGGYIWHTTGSGKTLTSFKTAQLATALPQIDKVIFVVDRKDLDYQTMKEYDRFEKGAANSNTSTAVLKKQLEYNEAKIIITTIQKLDRFISQNAKHEIYNKHIVLIFDECHRSQFGEMHQQITKHFKKYHIFGFTGTPIFAVNAAKGKSPTLKTTEQAFGDKLHTYTIVDAINDGNVLPFRIDFVNTIKESPEIEDKKIPAIDIEKAMMAPKRIEAVSQYILEHFEQKTKRNSFYTLRGQRLAGFNSIFAVASIPMAKAYYVELKKQLAQSNKKLNVATIFSFSANEDDPEDVFPDEGFENDKLDKPSRDFLEEAIKDYNQMFSVNYDTSSDKFQNYYKDLSLRVKNREVDLLLVVNMFLTGFDATTLNTLWVDKNLRQHGLLQAFSRTNRILNSVKSYGNIVSFRDLKEATDESIALFGDREAGGIVLLKTFDEYYNGYLEKGHQKPGYQQLIDDLQHTYPLSQEITGEDAKKDFIRLFGSILRLRNILTAFDDFSGKEILSPRDFQDYQSRYIDLYNDLKPKMDADKENINEDLVFELELIKQIEVNIDYILLLVAKYHESQCKDKDILVTIDKAINSSIELRSKKELIERFISRVNVDSHIDSDWKAFIDKQKEEELSKIIADNKMKPLETRRFLDGAFRDGVLRTTGTDIDRTLPPISRFGSVNRYIERQKISEILTSFFVKYLGLT